MSNVKTIEAPFEEIRAASTAGGGTVLSTTLALISLPIGGDWLTLIPRNFVTAVVAQYALNPWLTIIATTDALATPVRAVDGATSVGNTDDISKEMQDGDSVDYAIGGFSTAAANNYIYAGSWLPFRGAQVALNDKNDVAKVLTVKYPGLTGGWSDISATDGTDSGGDSLKVDGDVTWAVPAAWKATSLLAQGDTTIRETWSTANLFWTRWEWSAGAGVLDTTDLVTMRALNRSTNYFELPEGVAFSEAAISGPSGFSCVEALVNAGSGNLIVNAATKTGTETRFE